MPSGNISPGACGSTCDSRVGMNKDVESYSATQTPNQKQPRRGIWCGAHFAERWTRSTSPKHTDESDVARIHRPISLLPPPLINNNPTFKSQKFFFIIFFRFAQSIVTIA